MSALSAALRELVGLFVDDSALALLAALVIAIVTLATKLGLVPPLWGAFGLVLGCAVALAASLVGARRGARP